MIRVDEAAVHRAIVERSPKTVLFTCPEALLKEVRRVAKEVERRHGVATYVFADSCYGACDTHRLELELLGADLELHVGHTSALDLGEKVVFINAFDDVTFDGVLEAAVRVLKGRRVGLATTSQHLHQIDRVEGALRARGLEVVVGEARGRLLRGQVFGCEFHTAYHIRDRVDAFAFLGQSRFHAIGVALSTGLPTYLLDPYYREVFDLRREAEQAWKRAVLAVYRALDAESFGLILGLKEGQLLRARAQGLKEGLEALGREVEVFTLREVTPLQLERIDSVDAFIQTACPRLSMEDSGMFRKPLLNPPQADALLELLRGHQVDMERLLQRPHWL
jgi:2-(3-amino-3-carboxypropyl)histidine synthase